MWRDLSEGDFIVTHQEKNYSLLRAVKVYENHLVFEEISIPENSIDLSKESWRSWIAHKAPKHTSWISYEIDLSEKKLVSLYSVDTNTTLQPSQEHNFLVRLLNLDFSKVSKKNRKKIGLPTEDGPDTRGLWIPPVVFEGLKLSKPEIEVWSALWPNDNSPLSGSQIDLYWNPPFPLPYWIEIKGGHYTFKLRVIESGKNLLTPLHG